jgi:hypothetical protein
MVRQLGWLTGCATIIAAVAFVLGLIGSLFAASASLTERLLMAAGVAAIAFIAALQLGIQDHVRHAATIRAIRRRLLARDDVTDKDFLSRFPESDPVLLLQIRQAVSEAFRVPTAKVHPGDNLHCNYRCDVLEPGFHSFVVRHVLKARSVAPSPGQLFTFHSAALSGFGDLAKEVRRILDGFASGGAEEEKVKWVMLQQNTGRFVRSLMLKHNLRRCRALTRRQ